MLQRCGRTARKSKSAGGSLPVPLVHLPPRPPRLPPWCRDTHSSPPKRSRLRPRGHRLRRFRMPRSSPRRLLPRGGDLFLKPPWLLRLNTRRTEHCGRRLPLLQRRLAGRTGRTRCANEARRSRLRGLPPSRLSFFLQTTCEPTAGAGPFCPFPCHALGVIAWCSRRSVPRERSLPPSWTCSARRDGPAAKDRAVCPAPRFDFAAALRVDAARHQFAPFVHSAYFVLHRLSG